LLQRAAEAEIEVEVRPLGTADTKRLRSYAILQLPNGRRRRAITVFPNELQDLLAIGFEHLIVLGDYQAVLDKRNGKIEAQVVGPGPVGRANAGRSLQLLPGVEIISDGSTDAVEDETFEDDPGPTANTIVDNWRLAVENDGVSIEISPASQEFETLFSGGTTVKINGVETSTHDSALEALDRYASAMLFDIDLVYGLPVQIAIRRRGVRPRRRDRPENPPKFPRNRYAGQALELYQYGRSAAGLPLLEYLAYYQSVEYFFPFFAREQTVNSVRSQLLHPGFDAQSDAALNRLINLAAPAARGGMAEREQLRATVRASMAESDVREFIESLPEYTEHFCSKTQAIKGVGVIQLSGSQSDLRDQAADRIYAIRCRIVHSKQDSGGTADEVLLPASGEAESLQADIELLRLVAQRTLIARAARA